MDGWEWTKVWWTKVWWTKVWWTKVWWTKVKNNRQEHGENVKQTVNELKTDCCHSVASGPHLWVEDERMHGELSTVAW